MSTSEKSFFIIITFTHTEQEKEGEEGGREGGKREGENKGKGRGGSGNEKSPAAAASGSLRSGISGYQVSVSGEVKFVQDWNCLQRTPRARKHPHRKRHAPAVI